MNLSRTIRLADLAHARSGDKGRHANIGVVVDEPAWYDWVGSHLSAGRVADYFAPLGVRRVVRYSLPLISAYNFVLEDALGGGASRSLRLDTQGKALGVALLELELPAPDGFETPDRSHS